MHSSHLVGGSFEGISAGNSRNYEGEDVQISSCVLHVCFLTFECVFRFRFVLNMWECRSCA